jgi:hypothetical protein
LDVTWEVEYSDEFDLWWNGLGEDEQEDVAVVVGLLQERGTTLKCRTVLG